MSVEKSSQDYQTGKRSNSDTEEESGQHSCKKNVLVGCTGSVASIKIPPLVAALSQFANVKVVATDHATHFFSREDVAAEMYTDEDEWSLWQKRSDPVLHIELRRWADVFVIAPVDANTLAKMTHGICDNLLTCVVRAWDVQKPLLFAPAMNTHMWKHPLTSVQIDQLKAFGYGYIPVIEKMLICGDKGIGAMAEVDTIIHCVKEAMDGEKDRNIKTPKLS